jgi:hypothetical protein
MLAASFLYAERVGLELRVVKTSNIRFRYSGMGRAKRAEQKPTIVYFKSPSI